MPIFELHHACTASEQCGGMCATHLSEGVRSGLDLCVHCVQKKMWYFVREAIDQHSTRGRFGTEIRASDRLR
jgi:hypothetical protein